MVFGTDSYFSLENQPFSTGEVTRFSSDIYCVHC